METYIGLDPSTVANRLQLLHGRWRSLFPAYGLVTFADWHPKEHLPRYLNDPKFSDKLYTRQEFLCVYTLAAEHSQAYLRALPKAEQTIYQRWTLPLFPKQLTK